MPYWNTEKLFDAHLAEGSVRNKRDWDTATSEQYCLKANLAVTGIRTLVDGDGRFLVILGNEIIFSGDSVTTNTSEVVFVEKPIR